MVRKYGFALNLTIMNIKLKCFALIAVVQLCLATNTFAELAKDYQVTGPVLEVNDKMIVVQKGDEKWEIARDPHTKSKTAVKVGDKVTIHYRMTAISVENKDSATKVAPKKK